MKFPTWWGSGYFLELHNVPLDFPRKKKNDISLRHG